MATDAAPRELAPSLERLVDDIELALQQGEFYSVLVAVNGLAHAWSGGAASQAFSDGQGPDASRMAWAFAAKQFPAGA